MRPICIKTYPINIIELLVHSLVLLQKSTIYWDNPRTCTKESLSSFLQIVLVKAEALWKDFRF